MDRAESKRVLEENHADLWQCLLDEGRCKTKTRAGELCIRSGAGFHEEPPSRSLHRPEGGGANPGVLTLATFTRASGNGVVDLESVGCECQFKLRPPGGGG